MTFVEGSWCFSFNEIKLELPFKPMVGAIATGWRIEVMITGSQHGSGMHSGPTAVFLKKSAISSPQAHP